jgi:Ca-activated chloride channel homolog
MGNRKKKMKTIRYLYLLVATLALVNLGAGNRGASLVEEGNRLFGEGKYDKALTKYSEAELELPESPDIYYNIGDVQYEKGDYEKASALFMKTGESEDISLNARAGYNLGNTFYKEGKFKEAAGAYKSSLKLNPDDKDAKYNYELARLKMQEQQQEQQQKQDQQEQKDPEKEKEEQEQEDQQNKDQEEERKEKEDKQDQQQENQDKSDQSDQQQQPPPEEGEEEQTQPNKPEEQDMNQEDVERLLDAMLAEEEDQRSEKMEIQRGQMPEVLKDW